MNLDVMISRILNTGFIFIISLTLLIIVVLIFVVNFKEKDFVIQVVNLAIFIISIFLFIIFVYLMEYEDPIEIYSKQGLDWTPSSEIRINESEFTDEYILLKGEFISNRTFGAWYYEIEDDDVYLMLFSENHIYDEKVNRKFLIKIEGDFCDEKTLYLSSKRNVKEVDNLFLVDK